MDYNPRTGLVGSRIELPRSPDAAVLTLGRRREFATALLGFLCFTAGRGLRPSFRNARVGMPPAAISGGGGTSTTDSISITEGSKVTIVAGERSGASLYETVPTSSLFSSRSALASASTSTPRLSVTTKRALQQSTLWCLPLFQAIVSFLTFPTWSRMFHQIALWGSANSWIPETEAQVTL
jgi:hypothetical protein